MPERILLAVRVMNCRTGGPVAFRIRLDVLEDSGRVGARRISYRVFGGLLALRILALESDDDDELRTEVGMFRIIHVYIIINDGEKLDTNDHDCPGT